MSKKQIDEMAKAKKCNACIHNAVCEKLEEFRDSLGWVSTEGKFVCSYYEKAGYRKATEVAKEIIQDIIEPIWNAYKDCDSKETVLLVALICESINTQLKKKYEVEK